MRREYLEIDAFGGDAFVSSCHSLCLARNLRSDLREIKELLAWKMKKFPPLLATKVRANQ
jgi:hypothetical protein